MHTQARACSRTLPCAHAHNLSAHTPHAQLADFGMARVILDDALTTPLRTPTPGESHADTPGSANSGEAAPRLERSMTMHVVTRWYRAPELLLRRPYDTPVDCWCQAALVPTQPLIQVPNGGLMSSR